TSKVFTHQGPERLGTEEGAVALCGNGKTHEIDGLSDEQFKDFSDAGARRVRGLVDIRDQAGEDLFELIYQQNPKSSGDGDFTDEILDSCDDPERTLGIAQPNELRLIGVE
ncbi:hypothetical protein LCGC14_3119880, partial [marine sediment metagenome]